MTRLNGYLDAFISQAGWRQHGGFWSGISVGNTIIQSSGTIAISGFQNFEVQVFGGSGGIRYFQGPYEGWQVKMANLSPIAGSGFNGFFPIAISGILCMQDVYAANPDIMIQTPANPGGVRPGNMTWITNDRKFFLVQGQRAPLNISGALKVPIVGGVSFNDTGDIAMCHHAQVMQANSFAFPATSDEADARALGPGTLTLNTGSGIINIMTGSGIAFVTHNNDFTTALGVDNYVRIPLSGMVVNDLMFTPNTTGSGISFMNTGMYMVTYNVSLQKIAGTASRTFSVRGVLRNKGGEGETPGGVGPLNGSTKTAIPGSLSWGTVTNVTTLPWFTINGSFLVNADAGQFLGFEIANQGTAGTTGNTTVVSASGTYAMIQYIGPKRSFFPIT